MVASRSQVQNKCEVSNWSWLPTCAIAMSMSLYCTSEAGSGCLVDLSTSPRRDDSANHGSDVCASKAGSGCLVDLSTSPRRDDSTNHGSDVCPSKAIVLRGNIVV